MIFEVNVEKKYVFMILGSLLILSAVIGVYAAVDKTGAWHDSEGVEVNINDSLMSLQDAIDGGYFAGGVISESDILWVGKSGMLLKDGAVAGTTYSSGNTVGDINADAKKENGKVYLKIRFEGKVNYFYSKTCNWQETLTLECTGTHVSGNRIKATATITSAGIKLETEEIGDISGFSDGSSSASWE